MGLRNLVVTKRPTDGGTPRRPTTQWHCWILTGHSLQMLQRVDGHHHPTTRVNQLSVDPRRICATAQIRGDSSPTCSPNRTKKKPDRVQSGWAFVRFASVAGSQRDGLHALTRRGSFRLDTVDPASLAPPCRVLFEELQSRSRRLSSATADSNDESSNRSSTAFVSPLLLAGGFRTSTMAHSAPRKQEERDRHAELRIRRPRSGQPLPSRREPHADAVIRRSATSRPGALDAPGDGGQAQGAGDRPGVGTEQSPAQTPVPAGVGQAEAELRNPGEAPTKGRSAVAEPGLQPAAPQVAALSGLRSRPLHGTPPSTF